MVHIKSSDDYGGLLDQDRPMSKCGYTYPEDHDVEDHPDHQSCCYRETLPDTDRCAWHALPDETDEKTVEALQAARAPVNIRKQNNTHKRNFTFTELLDGAILFGLELKDDISFKNVSLRDADFTNADLDRADFSNANLVSADFSDTHLWEAIFTGTKLIYSIFTDADLQGADLTGANLMEATCVKTIFHKATLIKADLRWIDLTNAVLWDVDFTKAIFRDADLTEAFLRDSIFIGANLQRADLTDANLHRTDLTGADLQDALLTKTNFTSSTIRWANISEATAVSADFTNSDLVGANFESTILRDSVFDGATLFGVRLYNTKLHGASINDQTVFGDRTVYEREADPCEHSYSGIEPTMPVDDLHSNRPDTFDFNLEIDKVPDSFVLAVRTGQILNRQLQRTEQRLLGQYIDTLKREITRFKLHYELDALARRETREKLSRAISVYRSRQRLHRENSQPEDVEAPYIREKSCRRKRAFVQEQGTQWLKYAASRWVMQYGESPTRVILTSIAVIVLFAFLYPFFGGVHIEPTTATHMFFDPSAYIEINSSAIETISASLYFSAVTFSTLGYGGIQPATAITQFLASVQSLIGGILIALLVAVFARRALR